MNLNKLPIKISLVFGYNTMFKQIVRLPKTDYRDTVGDVKKLSHYQNSLHQYQMLKDMLKSQGEWETFQEVFEGNEQYITLPPDIEYLNSKDPKLKYWIDNCTDSINRYLNCLQWDGTPYQWASPKVKKCRELLYNAALQILKNDNYTSEYVRGKINWKTQDVITFYQFNNETNQFEEVSGK